LHLYQISYAAMRLFALVDRQAADSPGMHRFLAEPHAEEPAFKLLRSWATLADGGIWRADLWTYCPASRSGTSFPVKVDVARVLRGAQPAMG
jgi:hypothetical protein